MRGMRSHDDQASDDDLVAALRTGRLQAFKHLIRRHYDPIRAWLIPRCPPEVDAEDLVQQTFLAAYRKQSDYTIGTSFPAWLFAIARRELAQECRRRHREQSARGELLHAWISAHQSRETDLTTTEPDRRLDALGLCLRGLREGDRHLITERYRARRSIRQLAHTSRQPEGTIKKRLFTLRRWLQDCIARRLSAEDQ